MLGMAAVAECLSAAKAVLRTSGQKLQFKAALGRLSEDLPRRPALTLHVEPAALTLTVSNKKPLANQAAADGMVVRQGGAMALAAFC
jgi:hypothetical protein